MDQFYSVIYWLCSVTKIATEGGRFSQATVTSRDREASEMDLICCFFWVVVVVAISFACDFFFFFFSQQGDQSFLSNYTQESANDKYCI